MADNLLKLQPENGDLYAIHYTYSGPINGAGAGPSATGKLRGYFRDQSNLNLIQVQKPVQTGGEYYVRVKVSGNVEDAEALFDPPEFKLESLKEIESMLDRIITTLIGFFMG